MEKLSKSQIFFLYSNLKHFNLKFSIDIISHLNQNFLDRLDTVKNTFVSTTFSLSGLLCKRNSIDFSCVQRMFVNIYDFYCMRGNYLFQFHLQVKVLLV